MWEAVSAFAAGGEEAVKMTGGQAATLLLQHLKQEPMPIIEERDCVRVELTTSRNDDRAQRHPGSVNPTGRS